MQIVYGCNANPDKRVAVMKIQHFARCATRDVTVNVTQDPCVGTMAIVIRAAAKPIAKACPFKKSGLVKIKTCLRREDAVTFIG